MSIPNEFQCFMVRKPDEQNLQAGLERVRRHDLPESSILIRVQYSSLNYKDALAATGHPGVARALPLVPGIDAVGEVVESQDSSVEIGQQVMIAGADFGTSRWGGWSEYAAVSPSWCLPLPVGLSPLQVVSLGTAGFTAAQCIDGLLAHGVGVDDGPIVVSGATGGVGILAIRLLAQMGYHVVASTGKHDAKDILMELGAKEVIGRDELNDQSGRPLLGAKWAGAVDTVGGNTLGTILRSTLTRGVVTACGMVGGVDMPVTVYPFILRGVLLQGIDSATVGVEVRRRLWERLASDWMISDLERQTRVIHLSQVQGAVDEILDGKIIGRVVVAMDGANPG